VKIIKNERDPPLFTSKQLIKFVVGGKINIIENNGFSENKLSFVKHSTVCVKSS